MAFQWLHLRLDELGRLLKSVHKKGSISDASRAQWLGIQSKFKLNNPILKAALFFDQQLVACARSCGSLRLH